MRLQRQFDVSSVETLVRTLGAQFLKSGAFQSSQHFGTSNPSPCGLLGHMSEVDLKAAYAAHRAANAAGGSQRDPRISCVEEVDCADMT